MERKAVGFEQLSDIFGFRVVVRKPSECYQALGIVHTTWPVVPGRFKDYGPRPPSRTTIARSTTTVIGPGKQRVELQIRTVEMDQIAEFGIAAHSLYKGRHRLAHRDAVARVERLCVAAAHHRAAGRRLEPEDSSSTPSLELFHDQVFCFTPKGKLIALPRKADPIDSPIGHTTSATTRVRLQDQRKIAPWSRAHQRRRGRDPDLEAQVAPPAAWESLVVTGKARAAIRRATRAAVRAQYAELGRASFERLCQARKRDYSTRSSPER